MKKTKTRQAAPAAKPAATKKFRFRVVGGKHTQDGLVYKPGQIIESDTDLAEKFANRFKRLNGAQALNEDFDEEAFSNADVLDKPTKLLDKAAPEEVADDDDADDEITSDLGENVTEDFDAATDAGLLVFKSKAGFYVTTTDDADKALNRKPLKQSAVGDFISDQSDDAEDEDDEDDEPAPKKTVKVSKKKSK